MKRQRWRVQAYPKSGRHGKIDISDLGELDEIVSCAPNGDCWLHVERMNKREFFVNIGDRYFRVYFHKQNGSVSAVIDCSDDFQPVKTD